MALLDKDTFNKNADFSGSKGLLYIGEKLLVYRRDGKTDKFPFYIDLPGGGRAGDESPFETFRREVSEEFGLIIERRQVVYARKYPSIDKKHGFGYFVVAKLPAAEENNIHFGTEGDDYFLMAPTEYLLRTDAWPVYQQRTADYFAAIDNTL